MAKYPPPSPTYFRAPRSSSIRVIPTQSYNSTGKVAAKLGTSRPQFAPRRMRITAADITGPDGHVDVARIVRMLNDIQEQLERSTAGARSNPLGAPCIVRGIPTTNGTPKFIPHDLGRAWTGLWCVNQAPGAPFFEWNAIPVVGYPNGLDPSMGAYITPLATGTYDLAITGD